MSDIPWRAELYLLLFERAFDRSCDPQERARCVEVMGDLVPNYRHGGSRQQQARVPACPPPLAELIREVLHDRLTE